VIPASRRSKIRRIRDATLKNPNLSFAGCTNHACSFCFEGAHLLLLLNDFCSLKHGGGGNSVLLPLIVSQSEPFPNIARLAKAYLVIPATSSASEVVFSVMGICSPKVCNRKLPAHLGAEVILRSNVEFVIPQSPKFQAEVNAF
jgi:hypothetical protein